MTRRVIATIHFNTDKYGSRRRTGAFDETEFAKLTQDFNRTRASPKVDSTPFRYVIYSLDNPAQGEELRLFFNEVERITRDEQGNNSQ